MDKFIKSPLNYIGGKYKLLKDILKEFPQNIDNFLDMFAGGLNVGINVEANNIYVNDQITYLIEMYDYFKKTDIELLVKSIEKIINDYKLSKTNTAGYNKLREDYNNNPTPLVLFILTCYSFNHQMRFNNSHKFNTSFGRNVNSYNENIKKNLLNFCTQLQKNNYILTSQDFRNIDYSFLKQGDVVYCDPPYLITTAPYNDGKRGFSDWTKTEDNALFNLLDEFNDRGIYFFLSNVFHHKGLTNSELINWSKKYRVIYIDKDYSNCNYHSKNTDKKTVEVIITNYLNNK